MNAQHSGHELFVALTGGIGSGKSTVASFFEDRHPVLYADAIARACMEEDQDLRLGIVELLGVQAYFSDGSLDGKWIAEVVFNDPLKLAELNALVHPCARKIILKLAKEHFAKGAVMVFAESALIYEAGLEADFDYVITVLADAETATARVVARDGSNPDVVRGRMQHQISPEEKASLADFTIRNTGSLDDLRKSSELILTILSTLRPRRS